MQYLKPPINKCILINNINEPSTFSFKYSFMRIAYTQIYAKVL